MISDTIAISPMAMMKFLMAFRFKFPFITNRDFENYGLPKLYSAYTIQI